MKAGAPRGWLGPWISESDVTPDLLKEAGYDYVLDWCHDDRPVALATRAGPLLSVPYPQEANDANAIVVRRMTAEHFADLIVDQFDEMLEQATDTALVCPISLHPHVSGQPHRLRQLRRAFAHIAAHRAAHLGRAGRRYRRCGDGGLREFASARREQLLQIHRRARVAIEIEPVLDILQVLQHQLGGLRGIARASASRMNWCSWLEQLGLPGFS